jgi:hypothetical protein
MKGWGYYMITENQGKAFLQKDFYEIWRCFTQMNELELFIYLNKKLKDYFNNNKDNFSIDEIIENSKDYTSIRRERLIRLWALLEYIENKDQNRLDFSKSIACFWEYPNLIHIEEKKKSEKNNCQIGNLLLGTSFPYNKDWLHYTDYPLMNQLYTQKPPIETRTEKIISTLKEFLNS